MHEGLCFFSSSTVFNSPTIQSSLFTLHQTTVLSLRHGCIGDLELGVAIAGHPFDVREVDLNRTGVHVDRHSIPWRAFHDSEENIADTQLFILHQKLLL